MTKEEGEAENSDESGELTSSELNAGRKRVDDEEDGDQQGEEGEGQDDDEANADLSLRIVAKAEHRRKASPEVVDSDDDLNITRIFDESVAAADSGGGMEEDETVGAKISDTDEAEEEDEEGRAKFLFRSETPEEGELQLDADGNAVLASELLHSEKELGGKEKSKKKKRDRKEKKEKRKKLKSSGTPVAEGSADKTPATIDGNVQEESVVMRRLLRGPRYFDPPEEQGQSCYNCGKVGHLAASCPEGPRQKPCYVCGGFGHDGRECPQKTECYVCKNVGHIAKHCPNKGSRLTSAGREADNVCLLCGFLGHEASNCYHGYDKKDLEQVECYVCKEFGHLCCAVVLDTSPLPVSCYDCGDMGHTGAGCAKPRWIDTRERSSASVCFKCGEEGHYARGCSKRQVPSWPPAWVADSPQGSTLRSVAGNVARWMDIKRREPRWSPIRTVNKDDRRSGPRATSDSLDNADDVDAYMGPIDDFISPTQEVSGYHSRRKRKWTSTSARR